MYAVSGCLDEDTIDAFFHAKLSREALAAIDVHIDVCKDCRVLLSSLAAREVHVGPFSATEFSSRMQQGILDEADAPPPFSAPPDARLAAGEVLAERFVIEDRVGAGGMAEVYSARDREGGAKVAVKVPLGGGPQTLARFEREAQLLVQLTHPAIVRHTANGRRGDETPFLAMEWLEGQDLAERLKEGPLHVADVLTLGTLMASALAAAHAMGIVHRDIKPSNIFLRDGSVRGATLIDFGVARQAAGADGGSLATRTGTLLGTLGYMAPEQALGAKTADARADMFSLGCVLFEALTGRRLFAGAHAVEVLAKLLTEPVPSPRSLAPHVPVALDALVLQMLRRDPTERPVDCAAVAAELERIRVAGPDAAPARRAVAADASADARNAPTLRRRRAPLVALLVAGAALTTGLVWRARVLPAPSPAVATASAPLLPPAPVLSVLAAAPATAAAATAPAPLDPPPATRAAQVPSPPDATAAAIRSRVTPSRAKSAPSSADPFGNSRN